MHFLDFIQTDPEMLTIYGTIGLVFFGALSMIVPIMALRIVLFVFSMSSGLLALANLSAMYQYGYHHVGETASRLVITGTMICFALLFLYSTIQLFRRSANN